MERERKRRQLKTASGSDKTSFFQVKKLQIKNVLENLFSYFVSNFFLRATSKFSINSFISTKFTSGNLSNIHNCMNMYYIFSLCVCVCVCLSVCEWVGGYVCLCVCECAIDAHSFKICIFKCICKARIVGRFEIFQNPNPSFIPNKGPPYILKLWDISINMMKPTIYNVKKWLNKTQIKTLKCKIKYIKFKLNMYIIQLCYFLYDLELLSGNETLPYEQWPYSIEKRYF